MKCSSSHVFLTKHRCPESDRGHCIRTPWIDGECEIDQLNQLSVQYLTVAGLKVAAFRHVEAELMTMEVTMELATEYDRGQILGAEVINRKGCNIGYVSHVSYFTFEVTKRKWGLPFTAQRRKFSLDRIKEIGGGTILVLDDEMTIEDERAAASLDENFEYYPDYIEH